MQLDPKKLTPMPGYVLVEPAEKQTQSAGGIYLAENSSDKPQNGIVLAIGSDWMTLSGTIIKSPVKVGDSVIYKKWNSNGGEIKVNITEYQFIRFDDILAVIK
jgi:chaperonin GroES